MTIVQDLLRLKEHRQAKAEMTVSACRLAVADAVRHRDEAEDALVDFRQWSNTTERDWYASLCREIVRVRRILGLLEDVSMLRRKELKLAEILDESRKKLDQSETALSNAREAHMQASRTREKFLELAQAQLEELRIEGERREDVETEELYAVRKDREEWGGGDDD